MAYSLLPRAFSQPETAPWVPRDQYLPGRWTGVVDLQLKVDPRHPLVVGAGWLDLEGGEARRPMKKVRPKLKGMKTAVPAHAVEQEDQTEVVADIVRSGRQRLPVVPGSSLKGAVRQAFELLTPSCEPGLKQGAFAACKVSPRDSTPEVCSACSLFGAMGLAGRVSFQQAEPVPGTRLVVQVRKVPKAWEGQKGEPGSVRVYDQAKGVDRDGAPRPEDESTRAVVAGTFQTRLLVVNAERAELGLLLASLGVGWPGPGPGLRLGGKKFHGFGGVEVQVVRAVQRYEQRQTLRETEAERWAVSCRDEGLSSRQGIREMWNRLHRTLQEAED